MFLALICRRFLARGLHTCTAGDWSLCLALCTPSAAYQKEWMNKWCDIDANRKIWWPDGLLSSRRNLCSQSQHDHVKTSVHSVPTTLRSTCNDTAASIPSRPCSLETHLDPAVSTKLHHIILTIKTSNYCHWNISDYTYLASVKASAA